METATKKKGFGKARIGLAVSSFIIVILLVTNVLSYANLQSQINTLSEQRNGLQSQVNTLQSEKTNLQLQVSFLQDAKLINISLEETDVRPINGTPYLHLRSAVVNVGSNTAYNCRLHVVLHQGTLVANDTYILLGSILGKSGIATTNDVQYVGNALTGWNVTLQWTG